MAGQPYTSLAGLADVYLEDSFVLDIEAHPGSLVFRLDMVLTQEHPLYRPPKASETYCYRRGELRFQHVRQLAWQSSGLKPSTDATGEIDYGSISKYEVDGVRHSIAGDWGSLEIVSQELPAVTYSEER
jgi:hypothetical protein